MRDLDSLPVTFHHEVPEVGGDYTLLDALNRPLWDLRISVMDRCNLRCSYCMPADSGPFDFVRAPQRRDGQPEIDDSVVLTGVDAS